MVTNFDIRSRKRIERATFFTRIRYGFPLAAFFFFLFFFFFFFLSSKEALGEKHKWSPRKVILRGKQGNFGERGAASLSMLVLDFEKTWYSFSISLKSIVLMT